MNNKDKDNKPPENVSIGYDRHWTQFGYDRYVVNEGEEDSKNKKLKKRRDNRRSKRSNGYYNSN